VDQEWAYAAEQFKPVHAILDTMQEKDQTSSRTSRNTDVKYRPQFEFIDLWLPQEQAIVTMPGGGLDRPAKYLAEEEYEGPERGPYEQLGFYWLDGELMPIGLMQVIYDLHVMINEMARKAGRDAEAAKTVVLYSQAHQKEAEAIRSAQNMAMVGVPDIDHFKELRLGGVSEDRYQYIAFLRQALSQIAGNTDLIGGTVAQSETLGQDQMLMNNAGNRLADLSNTMRTFTKRVMEKIGYYLWNSNRELWVTMDPGASHEWQALFNREYQQGEYLEYAVDIEPYSMRADSPEAVYMRMMQWLKEVILPISQLGMAQGAQLDVALVAEETAKRLNIPMHREMYRQLPQPSMEMAAEQAQAVQGGKSGSQTTNISTGGGARPKPGAQPSATRPQMAGAAG